MIFIVGSTFKYGNTVNANISSPSIQQRNTPSRRCNIKDEKFIVGEEYCISNISKKDNKMRYLFECTTMKGDAVEILFNSTTDGDDYIASISGKRENLKNIRKSIENSLTSG